MGDAEDLRNDMIMDRKRSKINDNMIIVCTNVWTIQEATKMAQRMQREEDNTDERALRVNRHSFHLKIGRKEAMAKIESYQDNIDNYDSQMK